MLELLLFALETLKYGVLYRVLFSKKITRVGCVNELLFVNGR